MSARDDLRRLRRHRVPAWWSDAKLGIFVHWTPASVPGFAPVESDITELMAAGVADALGEMPYTEWYENSLRFPDSSVSRHHRATYGTKPYVEFAAEWEDALAGWDPDDWARRFAATGARHVVLVTKHHDGYCLWPTEVENPNRPGWHCRRDVVGELREAVLGAGMRFGVYYSGGLDWTFEDRPIGGMGDMIAAVPRGAYPAYAEAHVRELIRRYRPSVLWNDIAWPTPGAHLWRLFLDYYAAVPDGVVNDRWMPWSPAMASVRTRPVRRLADGISARAARAEGGAVPPKPPHWDVRTPEYVVFPDVRREPWECVRGLDQSFGYNRASRPHHFLSRRELLGMLDDVTAKGGNLLLNVGPRGEDAALPDEQVERLGWLAERAAGPGATLVGSRPWVVPAATGPEGTEWRFWAADTRVHAGAQGEVAAGSSVVVPGLAPTPTTSVGLVGDDGGVTPLGWSDDPAGLRVELPSTAVPLDRPVVVADHVVARP